VKFGTLFNFDRSGPRRTVSNQDQARVSQKIQHAVRYTELSPARFRDFWKD
jgi:hypothetical protein